MFFFISHIFRKIKKNAKETKAMAIVILVKIKKLMLQCFPHTFS